MSEEGKQKKKIHVSTLPTVSLQNLRKSRRSVQTKDLQQHNHQKQSALFIDVQIANDENVAQQFAQTVRRVRNKPMGRYKHWSIDNVNTQCELVHNIRVVDSRTVVRTPFSERISNSNVLVLDMIGQHVGRLYTTVGKKKTDILTDDSCIADVFDISYHKPTQSFRMRVVPFKPSQQIQDIRLTKKKVSSKDADIKPLFGSWIHLFMESGITIHGKVVFSNATVVELMVKDTTQQKEWIFLSQGVSKSKFERPTVTVHTLQKKLITDGKFVWKHSQRKITDDSVDRMNYTTEDSPQQSEIVLRRFLERVAPNGMSNLKLLWTTEVDDTNNKDSVKEDISEHVTLRHINTPVYIEGSSHKTILYYPFSMSEQFRSIHKPTYVPVGLQLTEDFYHSFLYEHILFDIFDDDISNLTDRVLLPTTHELVYAQSLSSNSITVQNRVYVTLWVDNHKDSEHLLKCVLFCQHAQRSTQRKRGYPTFQSPLQFVDITEKDFSTSQPVKVTLELLENDARTLVDYLTGQVHIKCDKEQFLSTPEMESSNIVVAKHLGKMSQSFVYHNLHYSPLWGAHASTSTMLHYRPLVSAKETRSQLPLPLLHTVSYTKQKHAMLPLNKDVFFPQTETDSTERVEHFQSIQNALPHIEQKKKISQKIISKKLSSSRALYDMEQSFEPQWFNVQPDKTFEDPIRILNTHFLEQSHMPEQFVLKKNVHFVLCDSETHTHRLHYDKKPSEDKNHVEEIEHYRGNVSLSTKDEETTLNTYGSSFSNQTRLSQLSHVLYGALHAYPNASVQKYQTKYTKQYRHIDGQSYNSMVMSGVIALPRWSSRQPLFHTHDLYFSIEIDGEEYYIHTENVFAQKKKWSMNVSGVCRILKQLLQERTKHEFDVLYCKKNNVLSVKSVQVAFRIVDCGGLVKYGILNNESIYDTVTKTNILEYVLVPKLSLYEQNTVLDTYLPQYSVRFNFSVDDESTGENKYSEHESDMEVGDQHKIQYNIIEDLGNNLPFDDPQHNKLSIQLGRDGRTEYVSLPLQVCVNHIFKHSTSVSMLVTPSGYVLVNNDEQHIIEEQMFHTLIQKNEQITHSTFDSNRDILMFHTDAHKQYTFNLKHKTLEENIEQDWKLFTRPNTQCESFMCHPESNSVLEACVYRNTLNGKLQIGVYKTTDDSSVSLIVNIDHPSAQTPICCHLSYEEDRLQLNILDEVNTIHCYTWNRDTSTTQLRFEHSVDYLTIQVLGKETSKHTEWNAVFVNQNSVQLGDTFGTLHILEREGVRAYAKHSVECVSQSIDKRWYWKRLHRQLFRSLTVSILSIEQIENVKMIDCVHANLADAVRRSICNWFDNTLLETKNIAYLFKGVPLQSNIPLSNYLLQNVVGLNRGTPSPELRAHLMHNTTLTDCVYDTDEVCRTYVGGSGKYTSLSASDTRQFAQEQITVSNALSKRLDSVANEEPESKSKQKPKKNVVSKLPPKARNMLFYFKMSRLLKTKQGIAYVKNQYTEQPVFRHQFHKCKGHCYYKLLYKCKLLRVNGGRFPAKRWTDDIRDAFTTLHKGDVNHICNRCGDAVCAQDAGLRNEFDAFGGSSTHAELQIDEPPDTNLRQTQPELTFTQRECMQKVLEMTEDKQLSVYNNILLTLPVTNALSVFLKHFKMVTKERQLRTFILQASYNETVVLKVVHCALIAIQEKIDALVHFRKKVILPRKKNEEILIQSFIPHIHITRESISKGILPRADFRPKLNTSASPTSTPELQSVFRSVNERQSHIHNMFDWSTVQNTSELYERNDVYLCVNKQVVDNTSYTTLSGMILPQLQFNTKQNEHSDRIRVALAFPTCSRTLYVGGKYPLHIHEPSKKKHIQNVSTSTRTLSDNRRRQVIYKHVNPSTMKSQFPYALQNVLQQKHIDENDLVKQLQCLLGIVQKQKARLSTNPMIFTYPMWVQYYNQLDATNVNDKIVQLIKTMQFRFETNFEKDMMKGSYSKFISS